MVVLYVLLSMLAIAALILMFYDVIINVIEYKEAKRQLVNLYWDLLNRSLPKYERIIINDPAVIYFDANGNKYVSKAHNEPFDAEKGLLMCIAKSKGFNHNKIIRMLKEADNKKESE